MLHHPVRKKIIRRPKGSSGNASLAHLPPLLQRIYGGRAVNESDELDRSLSRLPSPTLLSGMDTMTDRLMDVIFQQHHLMVIGDYDADGATATAVAVRGLRALGLKHIDYLVPNRFEYGYCLTPEIVELAAPQQPDILLTEQFPFGRTQLRFELMPLLDAAKDRPSAPWIVSSIRDVLRRTASPARVDEMVQTFEAFDAVLGLTGLVVTKLDGTAKGGVLAAIALWSRERDGVSPVPVYFIGVGEKLADLETFDAREFSQALLT